MKKEIFKLQLTIAVSAVTAIGVLFAVNLVISAPSEAPPAGNPTLNVQGPAGPQGPPGPPGSSGPTNCRYRETASTVSAGAII